jgi:hypothetical protein
MKAASVLKELRDDACIPALIRAMDRGQMSWELAEAIKSYNNPALLGAIVTFLRKHGAGFPYGTRELLEVVIQERLVVALPAVRKMAAAKLDRDPNLASNRVAVGRALAFLGDHSGIPILIRQLVPSRHDEWVADNAGRSLNALTGLALWTEGGDSRAARTAYQSWYDANRDRLHFDPAMRRYEVRR